MRQNSPHQLFGRRVREARKIHGFSLAQLEARLDELGRKIDKSMLGRIERGDVKNPTIEHLVVLAAALDVAPIDLVMPSSYDDTVSVGNLPPVPADVARRWFMGASDRPDAISGPLRFLVGLGERGDIRTFLAMRPLVELEAAMRQMNMSDDQIEDGLHSLETGEIPWPTGRPTTTKEENDG